MREPHLTPQQLSERWDGLVAVKTLANWRCGTAPKGPAFRKLGNRVLYPLSAVEAFEEENEFRSTHDYGRRLAA
jgi:hypothetical protein